MKYLLHGDQKEQHLYVGLFAPLLRCVLSRYKICNFIYLITLTKNFQAKFSYFARLLATQYPQLCLAEDWLDEEVLSEHAPAILPSIPGVSCSPKLLNEGQSVF